MDYFLSTICVYIRKYTNTRIQNLESRPMPPRCGPTRKMLGKSQPHGQVHAKQPLKSLGEDAVRPKGKVAQLGPKAVEHQAETPAWAAQQVRISEDVTDHLTKHAMSQADL